MNHAILPLRQYKDKLELHLNCFKDGYKTLCYYKISEPQKIEIINAESANIKIENLSAAEYIFFAANDTNEKTFEIKIPIYAESKSDYFNKIINTIKTNDVDIYNYIVKNVDSDDYIKKLVDIYQNANDEKLKENCLNLITAVIENQNLMHSAMNRYDYMSIQIKDSGQINLSLDEKFIFNVCMFRSDKKYDYNVANFKEINTLLNISGYKENRLYYVDILLDGCLCRRLYFFLPEEKDRVKYYNKKIQLLERMHQSKINGGCILPADYTFEDDAHSEAILLMNTIYKKSKKILMNPTAKIIGENIIVEFQDYDFIKEFEKPLYITFKEFDTLLDEKNGRRSLIADKTIEIDIKKQMFNRENYYFYIEDETNNIISDIQVLSLGEEKNDDLYNDSWKTIQIKRFLRLAAKYEKTINNEINQYIENAADEEDKNFNIIDYIIFNNKNNSLKNIYMLYDIWLTNMYDYDNDFVNKQIYNKNYNMHVMPAADKNYVVKITRINNNIIKNEFITVEKNAVEIRINKDDFISIQAFNKENYKVSGFILFHNKKDKMPQYMIDQLEVTVKSDDK